MRIRERFNPRAPCGARQGSWGVLLEGVKISTHAPLAGRDGQGSTGRRWTEIISTHAPLAGRDCVGLAVVTSKLIFQPTRPLRGATAKVYKSLCTFLR